MKTRSLRRWALAAVAIALYVYGFGTCGKPTPIASAAVEDTFFGTINLTLSPTGAAARQAVSGNSYFYAAGVGAAARFAPKTSSGAARGYTIDISRLEGGFSLQLANPSVETGITLASTAALAANLSACSWFVYYKLSDRDEEDAWSSASPYYIVSGVPFSSGVSNRVVPIYPAQHRFMRLGVVTGASPFTKIPYQLTIW